MAVWEAEQWRGELGRLGWHCMAVAGSGGSGSGWGDRQLGTGSWQLGWLVSWSQKGI